MPCAEAAPPHEGHDVAGWRLPENLHNRKATTSEITDNKDSISWSASGLLVLSSRLVIA